ncbi:MAG: ABC transporter ATP-binding protein [Chloroflexota bacterium]
MKSLLRATSYLGPYWPTALSAFLSLVVVNAANLIYPQLIRQIIDVGIADRDWTTILIMTGGLLLIAVIRGGCTFLQGYLSEKASQGAAYDLRNLIYGKLQTLSFSYHDQAQTGQLLTRVTSDVEMVRQFTGQGLLQLLGAFVTIFGSAAILIAMNWRLGLLALIMLPLIFLIFGRFASTVQPLFAVVQARLGALNTVLEENLAGIRVVKSFVREEYERVRFETGNRALLAQNIDVVKIMSVNFPLIFFVGNLGTALVVWYGGQEVIGHTLTLGELVAFTAYLNFLMFPMFILGMIAAMMARAAASAHRIFEVVDAESDVEDRPGAIELPPIVGAVEFEQVSFRYAGAERDALRDVSLEVNPGTTVAIVGTTGSGKSTVINLIPRFYDPTEGKVLIDGHDVRDVTIDSLRRQIGVVLQDTTLFNGTIRENIAYGRPDATLDEIVAAAMAAQAHEFIVEQPEGYQTPVGEGGTGLSGGQRQRLAIARALLLDPRILILDDSTSSVDAETEYRIQQALDRLIEGRTTFIIAQRVSSVRRADVILVVDEARITAQGTHEDLLATSSLYGEIVSSQLHDDTVPTLLSEVS